MVSHSFYFHPYKWEWSHLTTVIFLEVETSGFECFVIWWEVFIGFCWNPCEPPGETTLPLEGEKFHHSTTGCCIVQPKDNWGRRAGPRAGGFRRAAGKKYEKYLQVNVLLVILNIVLYYCTGNVWYVCSLSVYFSVVLYDIHLSIFVYCMLF